MKPIEINQRQSNCSAGFLGSSNLKGIEAVSIPAPTPLPHPPKKKGSQEEPRAYCRISRQRGQRNKSELWRQGPFSRRTDGFPRVVFIIELLPCEQFKSLQSNSFVRLASVLNMRSGFCGNSTARKAIMGPAAVCPKLSFHFHALLGDKSHYQPGDGNREAFEMGSRFCC